MDAEGNAFNGTIPAENLNVYAVFEIQSYKVTWTVDGEPYATTTVVYGSSITAPEYVVPDGYEFSGWSEYPATMPAKDLTVTGTLTPKEYTITFMDGETNVGSITAPYGSDITEQVAAISVTAPEGHTFNCWMNGGKCVNLDTMPLNGMTVYADFTVDEFNVNFFATEGDSQAYASFPVKYGTELLRVTVDDETTPDVDESAPAVLAQLLKQIEKDPEKTGYTWNKWDTSKVPECMPAKNLNIYGSWTINTYKVTADGKDYHFTYGATVTIPDPTKEGHTFDGWVEEVPGTMPADNVVLTAKWTVNSYTITFDEGVDPITAPYGTEITWPANPTKAGHSFQGWDKNDDGVADELPETMPVDGLNLKAVWLADTVYITWVINGVETVETYSYGDTITALEATKAADNKWSYKFTGWDPALPENATATESMTYTAQFAEDEAVKYAVKFVDGETTVYETQTAWNAEVALEGFTAPEQAGMILTWTVGGEEVTFPYQMTTAQVTFLAKWTPAVYTLTVDGVEQQVAFGTQLNIEEPTKEGYTFNGWLKNGAAYVLPEKMPAENIVITSDWTVNTHKAVIYYYDADGGEVYVEKSIPYGTELKNITSGIVIPSHKDSSDVLYEFKEWGYSTDITNEVWVDYTGTTMPDFDLFIMAYYYGTGWHFYEDGKTYTVRDEHVYDWYQVDGEWYYFLAKTADDRNYSIVATDIMSLTRDGVEGLYAFDHETGKFLSDMTGIYTASNGDLYYVENGIAVANKGLVRTFQDGGHIHYYYFGCGANGCTCSGDALYIAQKNVRHWVEKRNGYLMKGGYTFGADGVIEHTENTNLCGIQTINGVKYYLTDGIKVPYGLDEVDGEYYYARSSGALVVNETYWVSASKLNGVERDGEPMKAGNYTFDEEGRIVFEVDGAKNGVYQEDDKLYFYKDGAKHYAGLIQWTGDLHDADGNVVKADVYNNSWIYVNTSGEVKSDCSYWISKTNNHMIAKSYTFDEYGIMEDGYTSDSTEEKNGVYEENGKLYYYVNNVRNYAGLIQYTGALNKEDGTVVEDVYNNSWIYVNTSGEVKSNCSYWISKNNGHMKNGSYTFDVNGIMTNPQPIA